jgi:ABC-2 type transport system permease protein
MSWLEQKLFIREPLTALFALALPLVVLFVMGGVFGNDSTPEVYRGVGAMDYYVPAYMALVAASVGLISLPTHIASDRERGVLKRYRASGVPARVVVGAKIVVTLTIAAVSGMVLISVAIPTYDVAAPDSVGMVLAGFTLVALSFAAIGVLLGAVLPSAQAAQALGVLLWFVLLILGGAGPPPEVLTGAMGTIGDMSLLRQAIEVMQDGWLSLDSGQSWLIVTGVTLVAGLLAVRLFRWE